MTALDGGEWHSLAVRSDGTVWAWGSNDFGQLGDGSTTDRTSPVQVSSISTAVAVAGGSHDSYALLANGTVMGWGLNVLGEIGDGTTTQRLIPVTVPGLSNVTSIVAKGVHVYALRSDGTVWAWGSNNRGELGDGSTTNRSTPVQVSGLANVVSIATGEFHGLAAEIGWNRLVVGREHAGPAQRDRRRSACSRAGIGHLERAVGSSWRPALHRTHERQQGLDVGG